MADTPFIRIKNISKNYGTVRAVDNINLDIYKNELFCLLGGSGCGKTTLLRMLAGFETPTEGTIEIDGQDMAAVPANQRPTNMMFQSYALFPHMSVEKNVAYGLKRDGVPKDEIATRVEDMLNLVQLGGFGKRKPSQLSGGQRQRVALARALIKRPKLLLLDEPLGALDKKLREETQFELINIQESLGITFVVVTHDQEEAMTLASRIAVMDMGKLVQVGTPHEIYESPDNRYVADFIGSVNLFDGKISADAKGVAKVYSDDTGSEMSAKTVNSAIGQQVTYAIRPEKMEISKTKPKGTPNIIKGIVEEIAYMGNQSAFVVKLVNGKTVRMTRTNRERGDGDQITWEDTVYLSWGADAGLILTS